MLHTIVDSVQDGLQWGCSEVTGTNSVLYFKRGISCLRALARIRRRSRQKFLYSYIYRSPYIYTRVKVSNVVNFHKVPMPRIV